MVRTPSLEPDKNVMDISHSHSASVEQKLNVPSQGGFETSYPCENYTLIDMDRPVQHAHNSPHIRGTGTLSEHEYPKQMHDVSVNLHERTPDERQKNKKRHWATSTPTLPQENLKCESDLLEGYHKIHTNLSTNSGHFSHSYYPQEHQKNGWCWEKQHQHQGVHNQTQPRLNQDVQILNNQFQHTQEAGDGMDEISNEQTWNFLDEIVERENKEMDLNIPTQNNDHPQSHEYVVSTTQQQQSSGPAYLPDQQHINIQHRAFQQITSIPSYSTYEPRAPVHEYTRPSQPYSSYISPYEKKYEDSQTIYDEQSQEIYTIKGTTNTKKDHRQSIYKIPLEKSYFPSSVNMFGSHVDGPTNMVKTIYHSSKANNVWPGKCGAQSPTNMDEMIPQSTIASSPALEKDWHNKSHTQKQETHRVSSSNRISQKRLDHQTPRREYHTPIIRSLLLGPPPSKHRKLETNRKLESNCMELEVLQPYQSNRAEADPPQYYVNNPTILDDVARSDFMQALKRDLNKINRIKLLPNFEVIEQPDANNVLRMCLRSVYGEDSKLNIHGRQRIQVLREKCTEIYQVLVHKNVWDFHTTPSRWKETEIIKREDIPCKTCKGSGFTYGPEKKWHCCYSCAKMSGKTKAKRRNFSYCGVCGGQGYIRETQKKCCRTCNGRRIFILLTVRRIVNHVFSKNSHLFVAKEDEAELDRRILTCKSEGTLINVKSHHKCPRTPDGQDIYNHKTTVELDLSIIPVHIIEFELCPNREWGVVSLVCGDYKHGHMVKEELKVKRSDYSIWKK